MPHPGGEPRGVADALAVVHADVWNSWQRPHTTAAMAFASKLSVGHQEIDRIIDEVEQTYRAQPTEWLPIAPVGNMVALQWYEDIDEFEDAIGGEFIELLRAMPHIEVRAAADGETPPGFFKVRELQADGHIRVEHVNTDLNSADFLTKALDDEPFLQHRASAMNARDRRLLMGSEGGAGARCARIVTVTLNCVVSMYAVRVPVRKLGFVGKISGGRDR